MEKTKICFIGTNPHFDGGITNYHKNIIKYIKSKDKNLDITWVYESEKDENYTKEEVNYVGLRVRKIPLIEDLIFNKKVKKYLEKNYFNIINSDAIWGYWMKNYKKKENQILVNTYHGVALPYYKIHLKRFGVLKKIILSPLLWFGYFIEKPPIKKADKIICVSEKVKRQIEETYWKRKNIFAVRTGVDLKYFKQRNKNLVRKEIGLEEDKIYGLYVAKGGYWIKGLDRAVKLSEEIYKENKKYRMIVIGPNYEKNKYFLNKEFIIHLEKIPRKKISLYYSASDIFFCLSRYEGGAPTLVTSEAMASGCLLVCSRDSEQEIIKNYKNGIIIENFNKKDAEDIMKIIKDEKKRKEIIKNSLKTIKELSLEKWGERYTNILI